MASGPITSWQIDGGKVETVSDFIFFGYKINVDGNCSHGIKKCLLLRRKAMTNLDSILKSRDINLLTKVRSSQSYGFSTSRVWMWELDHKECWVPNNWNFQTVGLEKTLESHLDSKEIKPVNPKRNQPWIFTESTEAEAEAPVSGHLMWRADSPEKTLMMGKIKGKRRRGQYSMRWQMTSLPQLTWVWANSRTWWRTGMSGVLQFMEWQKVRHNSVTEQQQ